MDDRGESFAVLRGPPWPPSGSAVEVIRGVAVKRGMVVEGGAEEGVVLGMAVEVVVVGIAVEGEDEGMTAEVRVEMVEVVTAEITSF